MKCTTESRIVARKVKGKAKERIKEVLVIRKRNKDEENSKDS